MIIRNFADFVSDQQPRHNLHMTHLDEALFEGGTEAAKQSIDALLSLTEGTNEYSITTKWDGAPAIFCGYDPADGKFFVGTKSVFNKTPKLYKESWDIISNEPAGKATKLVEALKWLPYLGIGKGVVLQGDLLWTSGDHKYLTYENKRYVTVHPNTLIYGWLAESDEGKAVRNAQLGIVFHTQYTGTGSLDTYQAQFGVDTSNLNQLPEIWVDNAYFKGREIQISPEDVQTIAEDTSAAFDVAEDFEKIIDIMNTIPSSAVGASIKSFYNSCIREGYYPTIDAFDDYIKHVKDYWDTRVMESVTTDAGKDKKRTQLEQLLSDMRKQEKVFHNAFFYTHWLNEAKLRLVAAIDAASDQKVWVDTADGLEETTHEGYVAINNRTGNAVKLINRLSFSQNNFSNEVKKGWQK